MNSNIANGLNKRIKLLSDMTNAINTKLKRLPEGRLYIKHSNGSSQYYLVDKSKKQREKYLGKDERKLIDKLIQREYYELVMNVIETESDFLRKTLDNYPETTAEDVYEQLSDERKNRVDPITLTDEQYIRRWQETPYTPKPFAKDTPFYLTKKGERVRSKSEMIIADRLLDNGIPYKYECPVVVGDNEIIHPDFTILRVRDRKIIYHEHCGKMSDPGYVEDMLGRSVKYSMTGIIPGDRLFYTFESSKTPLDVRVLDNMIRCNFR